MNELETRLHSWALRRPSARLEAQLFAPTPRPCEAVFHPASRWSKLAPSAVGSILVCFLLSQWNSPSLNYPTASALLPMPSIEHSAANHIARVSGSRASRTPDTLDMTTDSLASGITGMVYFPLLRTTNH